MRRNPLAGLADHLTVEWHGLRGPERPAAVLPSSRAYLAGCARCRGGDAPALNARLDALVAELLTGPDDPAALTSRILVHLAGSGLLPPSVGSPR